MKRLPRLKNRRRKRTNANIPAKGRLKDMADSLWSIAVRVQWGSKCAVCGHRECEAHHLVPRQHEATRYNTRNGIALCASHHQFDRDLSPHQNSAGWIRWLESNHPDIAAWYFENWRPQFNGTKNALYYCEVIRSLRPLVEPDVFKGIVGKKFSEYLEAA